MNTERWSRLMAAWGFGENQDTYRAMVAAYAQKHRYYHTAAHISACLRRLDACVAQVNNPREVEMALWFHDAVYNPFSGNNELRSAAWAASFLAENHAPPETVDRVRSLIMATRHDAPPRSRDESILVDIDLAILGASAQIYDVFEKDVRREYKFVPGFFYRKKRAAILRHFLGRDRIFQNEPFISDLEGRARENLARAVSNLMRRG